MKKKIVSAVLAIVISFGSAAAIPHGTFADDLALSASAATVNTDTCEALGLKIEDVKTAIEPLCTQVVETKTEQEFSK